MVRSKFKQTEIGEIPERWELREIGSLGQVITGKTPPTKDADNFGDGYPFITPRDMVGQKYVRITERYVTEKGKDTVRSSLLPANSVCVSCIGSNMGKVIMTDRPCITNQQLNSLVCEQVEPQFVYYGAVNIANKLRDAAFHSTAVPILNKSAFLRFEILVPKEKSEQRAIAKILSDLDDKIELNNLMNRTLESIAQAIFKRWFVDFEFPNEQGRPYKSFSGKMVESELGEIPKGWNIRRFADLVSNVKEPLRSGDEICDRKYVPIESLPMKRIGMIDYKSHLNAQSSLIAFEKDDILFGAMRAYFHRVNFAPFKGVTRTTTFVLRPHKRSYLSFALFLLNLDSSVHYANLHSRGSTMPYAVWDNSLSEMPVVLPADELLTSFHNLIYPFLQIISGLSEENIKLSQIRDSLLPKLMSGKIRVN